MSDKEDNKNKINFNVIVIVCIAVVAISIGIYLFINKKESTESSKAKAADVAKAAAEVKNALSKGKAVAATAATPPTPPAATPLAATASPAKKTLADDDEVLEPYIEHINERFDILDRKLSDNSIKKVIFAGKDDKHALGTGYAIGQWKNEYGEVKGNEYSNKIIDHITNKINDLKGKHGKKIEIGPVGLEPIGGKWEFNKPSELPSDRVYHVWGANNKNWNLPKGKNISGGGQASYFPKQQSGVFGIVTTPLNGDPTEKSIDNYS